MGQVLKTAQQGTAYLDVLYTYKDSREDICQSENTVLCWERSVVTLRVLSLSNYWTLTTLYMCCISGLRLRVWESKIIWCSLTEEHQTLLRNPLKILLKSFSSSHTKGRIPVQQVEERQAQEPLCIPVYTAMRTNSIFSCTTELPRNDDGTFSTIFASLFRRDWLLPLSVAISILSSLYWLNESASSSRRNPTKCSKRSYLNKWLPALNHTRQICWYFAVCLINFRNRDLLDSGKQIACSTNTCLIFMSSFFF